MLENLTKNFSSLLAGLRGTQRLTEANIEACIRSIRLALLESDVNLTVIQKFLAEIKQQALGQKVVAETTPADVFVKIVHDALVHLLGGTAVEGIRLREPTRQTNVLVSGLQGSGKTTTLGKLAYHYKNKRDVLLVSLDTSRPQAALQLKKLAAQAGVAYFERDNETRIPHIIKRAKKYAKKYAYNLIFYDTAGRTQVENERLKQLQLIYHACQTDTSLFVLDAMLGQKALNVAEAFKSVIPIDTLLVTKFDSDTHGGAILSVKYTLSVPISFVGVGEKIEQLQPFDPKRVAKRILGMGDVVGLVEKAQAVADAKQTERMAQKLAKNEFDLEDMLTQLKQLQKMGSLKSIIAMIPGMSSQLGSLPADGGADKEMITTRAIIQSMTREERSKPFLLNNSRKLRVAKGSGTTILKINQLLKKFAQMKNMMKKAHPTKNKPLLHQLTGQTQAPASPATPAQTALNPFDLMKTPSAVGSNPMQNFLNQLNAKK